MHRFWTLRSIIFHLGFFGFLGSYKVVHLELSFWVFLQEAESKAKSMEEQIGNLQMRLEERNEQLQASASTTEKVPSHNPVAYMFFSFVLTF